MLIEEAQWLGHRMRALQASDVYPLLDVGSSTRRFRTIEQPWIDELVFAPVRAADGAVYHLDAKSADGVDIVADLHDPDALRGLRVRGFKSVFCSNLLEHLPDPHRVAGSLTELVPVGGYLFVSCPYRYPFHPDPIDTMLRPSPQELAQLFPGTQLVHYAIVTDGTYFDALRRTPMKAARLIVRLLLPLYKPRGWWQTALEFWRHAGWLFRSFQSSCVVLIRTDGAGGVPAR